uniref:ATP-dependent DNA helicase n=1 Tax=Acrobeloides nanus TaxID=290746 RepID=A0A914DCA3_9BILA
MMKDVEDEVNRECERLGKQTPKMKLLFDINAKVDKRRYNIPKTNEVAAVIVLGDNDEMPEYVGIAVHQYGKQLSTLNKFNKNTEPMLYPIYFPSGKPGCHVNMKDKNGKKITLSNYYRYYIAIRKCKALKKKEHLIDSECPEALINYEWDINAVYTDFNPLRLGGKLYQQYLVDAYVKVEQDRLDYHRYNQKELKAEKYKILHDYLEQTADEQGRKVGKTFILNSSFKGSPRHCQQGYQDSMALVRKYGKPSLFITFTCNPKWPEIVRNLLPGNTVLDEPDLVCRVFNIKLRELMHDLTKKSIFGKVVAYTYVVEFQKRGLPHAHILLILDHYSQIRDPDDIDKVVCAEIPDKKKFPRLYKTVTEHMIHGPCGILNSNCVCMAEDEKTNEKYCTKDYPKRFREETAFGIDSYAQYRRRDGNTFVKNGNTIDNRWVVPYSPYLSLKYDAHINVEICASVKSVKYMYKYVYKGHDAARMVIQVTGGEELVHDEIKTYVDMRYITSHEAFWRIFELDLDDKSHSITRLQVHLPEMHEVYYTASDNIGERLDKAATQNTTLTAWFELNKGDMVARNYYYYDIPEHYTFKNVNNNMSWNKKGRFDENGNKIADSWKKCLGRMYTIHPKEGERFYLRLLLIHVKGAQSFDDLKTIEGDKKETFEEAAKALGLLDSGEIWEEYFQEVANQDSAHMLRGLFVSLIHHGERMDVKALWQRFKFEMCEDFMYRLNVDQERAENMAKVDIERQLEVVGISLKDYGIDLPIDIPIDDIVLWNKVEELTEGNRMRNTLNRKQKIVVKHVLEKVDELYNGTLDNGCIMMAGQGGSGKTYVIETLCHLFRGCGIKYKTSSWMGIAASMLPDGRTMHKTFGLPFEMDKNASSNAKPNNKIGKELINTKVFIIDEISMVSKYALEIIDRKLRELTGKTSIPFGGKVIIICGDFRQILPIERVAVDKSKGNKIKNVVWKEVLLDAEDFFNVIDEEVDDRVIEMILERLKD